MLNITRRRGERIVVGDNVFVTVMDVSGGTVRLGIDAPRSVRVYREEIWLEVKAQNEAAAEAASASLPDLPSGRPPGSAGASSPNTGGVNVAKPAADSTDPSPADA